MIARYEHMIDPHPEHILMDVTSPQSSNLKSDRFLPVEVLVDLCLWHFWLFLPVAVLIVS